MNPSKYLQPLTQFSNKKCKRCGFYEKGSIKADDVFDEWELCPSDFKDHDGKYNHFVDKEFNATFLCPDCEPLTTGEHQLILRYIMYVILNTVPFIKRSVLS